MSSKFLSVIRHCHHSSYLSSGLVIKVLICHQALSSQFLSVIRPCHQSSYLSSGIVITVLICHQALSSKFLPVIRHCHQSSYLSSGLVIKTKKELQEVSVTNYYKVHVICMLYFRSRKTHPGPVVHLSDNPLDPSKVRHDSEHSWSQRKLFGQLRFNIPLSSKTCCNPSLGPC